jgi:hypothetical protein
MANTGPHHTTLWDEDGDQICQDCGEKIPNLTKRSRRKRCDLCQYNARRFAAREYGRRVRGTNETRASAQLINGRWCCASCAHELPPRVKGQDTKRNHVICDQCRRSPRTDYILGFTQEDPISGCMIWSRNLSRFGYATYSTRVDGRTLKHPLHRTILGNVLGRDLTGFDVHHTCANRACINPAHLEAVPPNENYAEMRRRHYYEARIKELESTVRALDAAHPALTERGSHAETQAGEHASDT